MVMVAAAAAAVACYHHILSMAFYYYSTCARVSCAESLAFASIVCIFFTHTQSIRQKREVITRWPNGLSCDWIQFENNARGVDFASSTSSSSSFSSSSPLSLFAL